MHKQLKSKTSYLDQQQKREEVKRKSYKESEPPFTLRKKERRDTNFGEQGKVHVRYHRDKIGMSSDTDRVPCNERLYQRSYRNTWDPDKSNKLVHLARACNTLKKGNIKETSTDALCKLLQVQEALKVDMEIWWKSLLYGTVCEGCRDKDWGAQRKTDKTDKIYNWRSYQALHPAATQ